MHCCCCVLHMNRSGLNHVVVVVVSHIQRIGCQPEKTTLHGGQSRSWSAEQGKENKRKSLAAYPPPPTPHTARSEKINKITRRIYRRYAGGRSRVRTRIPSARRLGLSSNICGCQSGPWSVGQEKIKGTSTKLQREHKTKLKQNKTKTTAIGEPV